jgi:hypothetical protein
MSGPTANWEQCEDNKISDLKKKSSRILTWHIYLIGAWGRIAVKALRY